jgi:putative aldouronate transport system substrate-binding protein
VFAWWEIPEVTGEHADEYEYLTFLAGADGTLGVNLNEQGTTGHNAFAITSACKNPELLMKWIDQVYEPITSMQVIYGPIGEYFESEPGEDGFYVETPEAGGDLKARLEFRAPSRQLNSDFQTYYHMEARAQQRLDDLADVWFNKVTNFESYPSVVYTLEETETINEYISDIDEYVKQTSANWIINGGAADEFDGYVKQLENMGVNEVVDAWQSAYDRYMSAAN